MSTCGVVLRLALPWQLTLWVPTFFIPFFFVPPTIHSTGGLGPKECSALSRVIPSHTVTLDFREDLPYTKIPEGTLGYQTPSVLGLCPKQQPGDLVVHND